MFTEALAAEERALGPYSLPREEPIVSVKWNPFPFLLLDLNYFFHTPLESHTGCFYPILTHWLSLGMLRAWVRAGQGLGNVSLASLKETLLLLLHSLVLGRCPRKARMAGVATRKEGTAVVSLPQGFS